MLELEIHLLDAEGGMTNGRGMMRFSRGFMRFGKSLPIVPAAVRAAPAFALSTHTLGSSFAANMFWFCFAPWVELDVTVLPPMRPDEVWLWRPHNVQNLVCTPSIICTLTAAVQYAIQHTFRLSLSVSM